MEKEKNENLVELSEELRIQLETALQETLTDVLIDLKPLNAEKKEVEKELKSIKSEIKNIKIKLFGVLKLKFSKGIDIRFTKSRLKRIKKELKLINSDAFDIYNIGEDSFELENYSAQQIENREHFADKKAEQLSELMTLEHQELERENLIEESTNLKTDKKKLVGEKKATSLRLRQIQDGLNELYSLKAELTYKLKKLGNLSVEAETVYINPDDFAAKTIK